VYSSIRDAIIFLVRNCIHYYRTLMVTKKHCYICQNSNNYTWTFICIGTVPCVACNSRCEQRSTNKVATMDNAPLYNLAVFRIVSLFRRTLSMKNESLCRVSLNWKLQSQPVVVYAPCEWFWRASYLKLVASLCVSNMEPQTLSYNNEPTNAQYLYLHSYIASDHRKLLHVSGSMCIK